MLRVLVLATFLAMWVLYNALPERGWISRLVFGCSFHWIFEFMSRLRRRKGLWQSVQSWRDKIVVACSLAVTWILALLPFRLGITSKWIMFLMIVTGVVLGYTIWRCFGSPDMTRPDRSRSGADDG